MKSFLKFVANVLTFGVPIFVRTLAKMRTLADTIEGIESGIYLIQVDLNKSQVQVIDKRIKSPNNIKFTIKIAEYTFV